MAIFLAVNGYKVNADIEEQYEIMLFVASGRLSREELVNWLSTHIQEFQ